jgi:N6-L-threonylcarbamoyladenine synthase
MIVMGIDTSCDDTSVAITRDFEVLANVISSQDEIHAAWGGVVPNLARRAHEQNFPIVFQEALQLAHLKAEELDVIAVTQGHGLAIALEVGVQQAKDLATSLHKPLVAVHHSEGHFLANLAGDADHPAPLTLNEMQFPALAILVAGGQTQLVQVKALGHYEIIGETVDDALGEAFDKAARLLGLGYPGGAELSAKAKNGNPKAYQLPRPMRNSGDFNVSYAGLKTAFLRLVAEVKATTTDGQLTEQQIENLAASFQLAAVDTLLIKVKKVFEKQHFAQVFLGGGVAANTFLREKLALFAQNNGARFYHPYTIQLCRDNAAMIAIAGLLKAQKGEFVSNPQELDRDPQLALPS